MEQETKVSLRSALGEGAESHLTKLERLWRALKERKFPYQVGPYPPDHGEKHINKVLLNLCDLLISYRKNDPLSAKEKSYLFAAGMVHDIGMIRMRSTGADGPAANAVRISHPNAGQIASVAVPELSSASFLPTESVTIIKIASAHASDPLGGSAIKKIAELKASVGAGEAYVPWCAILLQAADLFDIGPDRLTLDVADQGWSPDQIVHYKKHATVKVQMYPESLDVKISLTEQHEIAAIKKITEIPAIEQAIILDNVYHEIEEKVRYLNEELKFTRIPWHVVADERLFGRPLPLGPSPGSFETTFDEALSQWRLQYVGQPFPVAMMGHSLYGRFVGDAENLNEKILHALEAGEIHLRVLVLDPNVENQQMCEVYDGQMVSPAEQGRSILPSYDAQGKVAEDNDKERGDILQTLHKLSRDWVPRVHGGSLLEVRATTRIMYTSISRFGDSLIVTPYRKTGLFRESQSWLYREKSPFYKAYTEVFQELWNSGSETTVRIVKVGKSLSDHNPMVEILRPLKDKQDRRDVSPLDYEHFMLSKYLDRIKAVFDLVRQPTRGPILPFEVEIQPSEECTLHCVHCVGRYLGSRRTPPAVLSCDLSSLLETEPEHPRIERFRISGLLGDPLSVGSREMVLEFLERAKKQGRDVVVLTNGLALEDRSVVERLTLADYVHVSLDAASEKTFLHLKGTDAFEKVRRGVISLCSLVKSEKRHTKVGLGFVVTQENADEVESAIRLADEWGVEFIRFKPDIRGMHAIGWRNWREAEAKILNMVKKQSNGRVKVVITDTGWTHYRVPAVDKCWAQFFYSTVGADGKLYPCDHLTANGGEAQLGTLGSFEKLWGNAWAEGRIGVRHRECTLCPPFGWRVNRFLGQLYALYIYNDWNLVEQWVAKALAARNATVV